MAGKIQMAAADDVWAFSICCVEILSMGRMPWPLMDDNAVRHFVLRKSCLSYTIGLMLIHIQRIIPAHQHLEIHGLIRLDCKTYYVPAGIRSQMTDLHFPKLHGISNCSENALAMMFLIHPCFPLFWMS